MEKEIIASKQTNSAAQVDRIKEEVDALQIAMMKQRAPWYKNVPIIISVIALLFSFGITFVSYNRTQTQDIQNLRSELRGVLQRITSISRDRIEMTMKYSQNPERVDWLSSYIAQENNLLAWQAAEIAKRLPEGHVSAIEYYTISQGLKDSYDFAGEEEFLLLTIRTAKKSKELNAELAALREYGSLKFVFGQRAAGRREYQKALNIFSRYKDYDDYTQKSMKITTELNWAASESESGFRDLANQHLSSAENHASRMAPGPGREQSEVEIIRMKNWLNSGESTANLFGGVSTPNAGLQK